MSECVTKMCSENVRCRTMSPDQKREIINFMKQNPQLKRGKFSQEFTAKKCQALWETLATYLNSFPGARKDWKKWRKTWHDMKSVTKSKKSVIKRHQEGTGGGPPCDTKLNDDDEDILLIIGKVAAEGDPDIKESGVEFKEESLILKINDEVIEKSDIQIERKTESIKKNDAKNINGTPKRIKRLEHSVAATEKLTKLTERKIMIKENYYNNKLELLRAELDIKRRIAVALEVIADNVMNSEVVFKQ